MTPRNLATRATDPLLKAMIVLAITPFGAQIKFKNESRLMWLLNRCIMRLFNPGFMDRFTTTVGSTVYFPSEDSVIEQQHGKAIVLAHEFVHIADRNKHGTLLFGLSYMFPQILAAPAIPLLVPGILLGALMPGVVLAWVAVVLGTITTVVAGLLFLGPWTWVLLGFLIFAAPMPAPWRMKWELRGYTMSMAMNYWTQGTLLPTTWFLKHFVGWNYYKMWPFKDSIQRQLDEAALDIKSGALLEDFVFKTVYDSVIQTKNHL